MPARISWRLQCPLGAGGEGIRSYSFEIGAGPLRVALCFVRLPQGGKGAKSMKTRRATPVERPPSGAQVAFGRAAVGAVGLGALAVGATAFGALAIGALAIRALRLKRGRIERLSVEELEVGRLRVRELVVDHERRPCA